MPFTDEYLLRPLKQLTRGDPVFVLPEFEKRYVLELSSFSSEFIWLTELPYKCKPVPRGTEVFRVSLKLVRVSQTYHCPCQPYGTMRKALLAPDFREVLTR